MMLDMMTSAMENTAMSVPTELRSTSCRVNWDVKKICWYPQLRKKHNNNAIPGLNARTSTSLISFSTEGFLCSVFFSTTTTSVWDPSDTTFSPSSFFTSSVWDDSGKMVLGEEINGLIKAYAITAVKETQPRKIKRIDTPPFHPLWTWLLMLSFFTRTLAATLPIAYLLHRTSCQYTSQHVNGEEKSRLSSTITIRGVVAENNALARPNDRRKEAMHRADDILQRRKDEGEGWDIKAILWTLWKYTNTDRRSHTRTTLFQEIQRRKWPKEQGNWKKRLHSLRLPCRQIPDYLACKSKNKGTYPKWVRKSSCTYYILEVIFIQFPYRKNTIQSQHSGELHYANLDEFPSRSG